MRSIHFFSVQFIFWIFFVNLEAAVIHSLDNLEKSAHNGYENIGDFEFDLADNPREIGVRELSKRYANPSNINSDTDLAMIDDSGTINSPEDSIQKMDSEMKPMTELYNPDVSFELPKSLSNDNALTGMVSKDNDQSELRRYSFENPELPTNTISLEDRNEDVESDSYALKKSKPRPINRLGVLFTAVIRQMLKIPRNLAIVFKWMISNIPKLFIKKILKKWNGLRNLIRFISHPRRYVRNLIARKGEEIRKKAQKYLDAL